MGQPILELPYFSPIPKEQGDSSFCWVFAFGLCKSVLCYTATYLRRSLTPVCHSRKKKNTGLVDRLAPRALGFEVRSRLALSLCGFKAMAHMWIPHRQRLGRSDALGCRFHGGSSTAKLRVHLVMILEKTTRLSRESQTQNPGS